MNQLQQAPILKSGKRHLLVFIHPRHAGQREEVHARSSRSSEALTSILLTIATAMIIAVIVAYLKGRL